MIFLHSGLLLALVQLAGAEENCTEGCLVCNNGSCSTCNTGYYGRKCDRQCSARCKDWKCGAPICPFGCQDGWYRLPCDTRCDETCESGRCDQFSGHCYDNSPYNCLVGICSLGCQQYCESDPNKEDEEEVLSEVIVIIVLGILGTITSCVCCLIKRRRNPGDVKTNTQGVDVMPPEQSLLPGQQSYPVASSTVTYVHAQFRDASLDPNNVLTYPSNLLMYPSNAPADVTSHFVKVEMPPPPPYEELAHSRELPAYESLFSDTTKQTPSQ